MKIIATLTGIFLFCATAAQASPAIHLETTLSATNPISITLRQNLDSQKPILISEIKTPHHYSFSEYETTNNKSDGFIFRNSNQNIMGRLGIPGHYYPDELKILVNQAAMEARDAYQRSYEALRNIESIQGQHAVSNPNPENQEINFEEVFPYFGISNSPFLGPMLTMKGMEGIEGNPEEYFGQHDEIHVERAKYLCKEFGFQDLELSKCVQREFHRSERRQLYRIRNDRRGHQTNFLQPPHLAPHSARNPTNSDGTITDCP